MSKNKHTQQISPETEVEAMKIARATQRPQQTKEQTKLIAQGIQKGIDQYKKQQKVKAREQDKRRKQNQRETETQVKLTPEAINETPLSSKLPWNLLAFTWLGIVIYTLS